MPKADQYGFVAPPQIGVIERWRRLGRLTLKELREILRDRRTIITLILMPVLVYPLLSIAFQQFFFAKAVGMQPTEYLLCFRDESESDLFQQFLSNYVTTDQITPPNNPADKASNTRPILSFGETPDLEAALRSGKYDIGIELEIPSGEHQFSAKRDLSANCRLIYLQSSSTGRQAAEYIRALFERANINFLTTRLKKLGVSQRAVPVEIENVELKTDEVDGTVSLTSVIPLILILMTITGAVYPAIDLTAGERERGTLEVLIAAPIPRLSLLIAKYVAVVTVAMLTASVNLLMMTVTLSVSGMGAIFFGDAGISPLTILQVFCLLILFATFFSAVLLALTSFARSFKEAQAYLIPLMLLSLTPGIMSLMPGLKLSGILAVVPLVNIVLLGRDLLQSQVEIASLVTVVISTSLYALVAIAIAGKIFGAEGVLYSTQGSWSDFLRRPTQARDVPTLTGAMFCLACIFPAYYILSSLLVRSEQLAMEHRILFSAAATGLLFGAFPAIAAYMGRVRPLSGFSLTRPRLLSLVGACFLGLSLWPFAYEIVLLTKTIQINAELQELAKEITDRIRSVHPVVVIIAYAVIPATFEELCFRGYLFNAVRPRTTALQTIVTTALIFGLFHFVTKGGLSFERLVNSTLLGLVLGGIRWRSGSVWPGIVMHTCHNGFLLLTAYYADDLMRLFPEYQDQQHLPASWLIIAGGTATVGIVLIQLAKGKRRDDEKTGE